jgi:hypothetical protein
MAGRSERSEGAIVAASGNSYEEPAASYLPRLPHPFASQLAKGGNRIRRMAAHASPDFSEGHEFTRAEKSAIEDDPLRRRPTRSRCLSGAAQRKRITRIHKSKPRRADHRAIEMQMPGNYQCESVLIRDQKHLSALPANLCVLCVNSFDCGFLRASVSPW